MIFNPAITQEEGGEAQKTVSGSIQNVGPKSPVQIAYFDGDSLVAEKITQDTILQVEANSILYFYSTSGRDVSGGATQIKIGDSTYLNSYWVTNDFQIIMQ